ncbi:MAG: hypothetical protein ABL921_00820 [Pirellula sp.]
MTFSKPPLPRGDKIRALADGIRANRDNVLRDILDPLQLDRFVQLLYHVEIKRAGIGEAILDGYFGDDIGVQDFEKPALSTTFERLMLRLNSAKREILSALEKEVVSFLDREQQTAYFAMLGTRFEFRETPLESGRRRLHSNGLVNPESIAELRPLLENASVLGELKLSDAQRSLLSAIPNRRLSKAADRVQVEIMIEGTLSKQEIQRLKQMAYQIELVHMGFSKSLSIGFLAKALELTESQRSEISKKAAVLETDAEKKISALEAAAIVDFLRELTPLQKERARELLGKPFQFSEPA